MPASIRTALRRTLPLLALILLSTPAQANFDGKFPGVGNYSDWKRACLISDEAKALKKKGDYLEAERLYKKALQTYSHDAAIYFNLGNCSLDAGKPVDAERAYRKSIVIEPNFENWMALTKVLIEQDKLDAASTALTSAGKYVRSSVDKEDISKYRAGLRKLLKSK